MEDPRDVRRDAAARMGAEAVQICEQGHYTTASGRTVDISAAIADAVAGTTSHPPEDRLEHPGAGTKQTRVSVCRETTLSAARRLAAADLDAVALNFASARNPGGGFLSGARAQEESLCRASALWACIKDQPMYDFHRTRSDLLYSSWMLYSPAVPVFRDDDGKLLDVPWQCAFITAPAPNAKKVLERDPRRGEEISRAVAERVERVLALAARHEHRGVVLGAWGCGAFGVDAEMVAQRFQDALAGPFRAVFEEVIFAVLDTTPDRRFVGPFERLFGSGLE